LCAASVFAGVLWRPPRPRGEPVVEDVEAFMVGPHQ
jgi:hypothetical protein